MSGARLRTLFTMDLRFHLARPLFWILVLILAFSAWGLSTGAMTISTGESTIGGTSRAWITSEYAIGLTLPIFTFLFYSFFLAVAAGMLVPRDDEIGVGPVLHATPLTAREYVWARFLAVLTAFLIVLALHLLFIMVANHLLPNAQAEHIRGPFSLLNYLRPALLFALPFILFLAGISLAIGALWRRPILVFVTPVALLLVSLFFLWNWSPSWLDWRINQILMWIEPSGFRWLNETWLELDRGVDFYNQTPIVYDAPFLTSRLAYAALGIFFVALAGRRLATTLRGEKAPRKRRLFGAKKRPAQAVEDAQAGPERPMRELAMKARRPGFLATVADVLRFEARNLRAQPGLYIFVPLILLQTIGSSSVSVGAFDAPLLLTPGAAAVGAMNTLTFLVCSLLLFYTVESLNREWATGLAQIYYASSSRTAAILTGKALANAFVGAVILLATYLGNAVVMLVQGEVTPSPGPFVLVWGLLLVPTFIVWTIFVSAVFALLRNRFATYGVGLAMMAFTGWKQFRGEMNWVGNWNLWNAATWTDFGALEPNGWALLLNRLFWLAVAAFLVALTVRIFPRRERDPAATVVRLWPRRLLRTAWRMSPVALPALVLGIVLGVEVSQGFGSGAAERREEEYHGRNFVTWNEAETPAIAEVDVRLELEPEERGFAIEGRYVLRNETNDELRRFPMSTGDHFEAITWTLEGEPAEPEDWARLHVFDLDEPLLPGETFELGFSFSGTYPNGISKNGGGMGTFILDSGIVLTSFASQVLPVPYFEPGRGVDDDNRLEPRDFEDGFWEGDTPPAFGGGARYPVRVEVSGPEEYVFNSVGVQESNTVEDGRRTVVWRSDHPVSFFNVVASADWEVWEGEGVKVFYHPDHTYNLEEIGGALEAARRHYSEWFYPFPWQELKLSEFPGLASYAQGFPTNITFSESIGFLTRSNEETELAFMVTAHEAAHQWWGNILMPGRGPGGNVLSEGMAHFSTALLIEEVKGEKSRMEFLERIEERYGERRRVDAERSLAWTDGSKTGDTTVTYDKGGWVFFMLLEHLGRDAGLAGYRDFIHRYAVGDDYPVMQDLVAVMREHAADPEAFDAFVEQWIFGVVMPEYRVGEATVERAEDGFLVSATVENAGTGRIPVEVAAVRGERFAEEGEPWRDARQEIVLGAGESATVSIAADFEPERLVVDPDVRVLMLRREHAARDLEGL